MKLGHLAPLFAVGAFSCGTPTAKRPDLLLITVDTLRRDHVSAYGLPFSHTTAIDRLAESGVLFERHYTVVGLTEPSHVSLFSGLYPRQHGVRRNGVMLSAEMPLLAEVLAEAGYRTGASIGAGVLGAQFGLDRGFDVFDESFDVAGGGSDHADDYERLAEDVVDSALGFLAAPTDAESPVFLWTHLFDPHFPHVRPIVDLPQAPDLIAEGADFPTASFLHDAQRIERMRRGYVAEVRYADAQIGRLLAAWDARYSGRRNVVVVTADHGEALGEHAYIGHSLYLYEEQIGVPLIIRAQDLLPADRRVASVTSVIDVGATILDLLDVPQPRSFGGSSLLRYLSGPNPDPASTAFAERPPLAGATKRLRTGKERDAENWNPKNQQGRILKHFAGQRGGAELGMVALITLNSKYIWAEDVPDELFDLVGDPRERTSIPPQPGSHPLRARIDAWRATTEAHYAAPKGADAARVEEMLDALGY